MIGAMVKAANKLAEGKYMETGYAMTEASEEVSSSKQQTKKKTGFIKRWLLKSVKEAVDDERRTSNLVSTPDVIGSRQLRGIQHGAPSIDQPERAIQFTVYTANGGRVVETRRYERKTDRHTNGLYVITNDQDFGREIDKIITQEALR
jgi:hypothetical protein